MLRNAYAMLTDRPLERVNQEDYALVRALGDPDAPAAEVFIVADGFGSVRGAIHPEQLVVMEVANWLTEAYDKRPELVLSDLPFFVSMAIRSASRSLGAYKLGGEESAKAMGGTSPVAGYGLSMTCLVIRGDDAYVAHTGATRLYRIRSGKILQITWDQTEAAEKLASGLITEELYHADPGHLQLTGGIGLSAAPPIEERVLKIARGDLFVMVTDGIHDYLTLDGIRQVVLNAGDCVPACQNLISLAQEVGSQDDMAAIVIQPGVEGVGAAVPIVTIQEGVGAGDDVPGDTGPVNGVTS